MSRSTRRPISIPSDILIHICSRLTTVDMGRKLGAPPLFGEGRLCPHLPKVPGLRPTSIPSGILMHPSVCHNKSGSKIWGLRPLFGEGELGPHLPKVPGLRPTSIPSDILMHPSVCHNKSGSKIWGLRPLFGEGELGPHLTLCRLSRSLPPYQVAS